MTVNNKAIYLDANFLVDWFASRESTLRKRARILLARILIDFDVLTFSPLTIDEAWHGIKNEISLHAPHSDDAVFSQIGSFTEKILNHGKMKIVQLQNPENGIMEAMNAVRAYSMKPRDAFHLSIMRDNKISAIATRDGKFIKKQAEMGISVIC